MANYTKEQFTLGEILRTSWELFWANWKEIFFVVLIVYIPVNIILMLTNSFILQDFNGGAWEYIDTFTTVSGILEGVIGILATMAIAWIVKMRLDGKRVTYQDALKKALSKWPAAFGTNIVAGICILGLTLLLIVPGIIFSIFWTFVLYAVVFEDKMFFQAMKHSMDVVRGRWWLTLGYLIVFGILTGFVGAFSGIPGFILSAIPNAQIVAFLGVFTDTIIDFAVAFFAVVSAVFFLNFNATKKKVDKK